jgi:hypothetical protein
MIKLESRVTISLDTHVCRKVPHRTYLQKTAGLNGVRGQHTYPLEIAATGMLSPYLPRNFLSPKLPLATLLLSTNHWPSIRAHVGKIAEALDGCEGGSVTNADCGTFSRGARSPSVSVKFDKIRSFWSFWWRGSASAPFRVSGAR